MSKGAPPGSKNSGLFLIKSTCRALSTTFIKSSPTRRKARIFPQFTRMGKQGARPAANEVVSFQFFERGPPMNANLENASFNTRSEAQGPNPVSVSSHSLVDFCDAQAASVFHLIEQPMLGIWSSGPRPVSATSFMASNRSRLTSPSAVSLRLASRRPRYCSLRSLL